MNVVGRWGEGVNAEGGGGVTEAEVNKGVLLLIWLHWVAGRLSLGIECDEFLLGTEWDGPVVCFFVFFLGATKPALQVLTLCPIFLHLLQLS